MNDDGLSNKLSFVEYLDSLKRFFGNFYSTVKEDYRR